MEGLKMTKLKDGELLDLLPESMRKDPDVIAISYALKMAMGIALERSVQTRLFGDIDSLEESYLDYLAVEMRLAYYDESFPLETKRGLIKDSFTSYMEAGTAGMVQRMIDAIYGDGEITEWFETAGLDPYTFEVKTDSQFTPETAGMIERFVQPIKSLRSHIASITAEQEIIKPFTHGVGYSWDETGTITNDVNINDKDQAYPVGQYFALGEVSELLEDVVLFRKELERDVPMPVEVGMAVSFDTQTILFETLGESEIEQDTRVGAGVSSDSLSVLM